MAIAADSSDPAAVQGAVQRTTAEFGGLDILVNNAGMLFVAEIAQFPDEQFERMLSVNVRAVFYASREAARQMRDGGRIINIGSVNSDVMPFPGGSIYAMTKGAIAGFTHGLARDLGPRGITVNNIQPGPIDTDLNPASGPNAAGLRQVMALGRFGKPEEIAALVSFLAGPEGAFITGASIKIDGGFTT